MLLCLHLEFPQNQIYIPEEDGDMCNILQMSFDADEEKSFFKVQKPDKNGMIKREISVDADRNGNQTLRRPITKIVLFVENEIDSPSKEAIRISQDETSTS